MPLACSRDNIFVQYGDHHKKQVYASLGSWKMCWAIIKITLLWPFPILQAAVKKKNGITFFIKRGLLNHCHLLYRQEYGNDVLGLRSGSNIVGSGQQQYQHYFLGLFLACDYPHFQWKWTKNWVFFSKHLTAGTLRKFLSVVMCKEEPN